MTADEVAERGLLIDENGKVLDEFGNEYRDESGCVCYIKRGNDMQVEDILLDAQDAFFEFDEENGNIFDEEDRLIFCDGFNRGQEAMRKKVLTMLGRMAEEE
jgi:hypothetical protein